jgi:hypothetical protein
MKRGWSRTLLLSSLVPLLASAGCDALTAHSFAGTVMQIRFDGATATPPGQHLELWATTQYNDIVRINPYYDLFKGKTSYGLMIREAIAVDSPCMINDEGYLLTDPMAYPPEVTRAGVTQTREQQAKQVVDRINQLKDTAGQPLLAVLPYDPTPVPVIPATATAAERLATCQAYESASDITYVPNPLQISAPKHGTVYGFVSFVSSSPPANYEGFRLDTPTNLDGVHEIFFTVENDNVDAMNRGPLYLISQPAPGGRDVLHFNLVHVDPAVPTSGEAALYVNLDQDPVQF